MILIAIVISLFGTIFGALIAMAVKRPTKDFIAWMLGFSSGVIACVVFLDLIPEVIKNRGIIFLSCYFIIGAAVFILIRILISNYDIKIGRMSVMTALAIMLHNFPEGVIMGIGLFSDSIIGIEMAIIIIMHDIPEGVALISSLMIDGHFKDKIGALLYVFITALPTTIGLLIGISMGNFKTSFLDMNFALAAGIMSYVCFVEMMPEAFSKGKNIKEIILSIIEGFLLSSLIILILH